MITPTDTTRITYTLQQSGFKTPTGMDAEAGLSNLKEVLAACNAVLADCVRNSKIPLSLGGTIHNGSLHLIAQGCEITTPKSIALRFLAGDAGCSIQEPNA